MQRHQTFEMDTQRADLQWSTSLTQICWTQTDKQGYAADHSILSTDLLLGFHNGGQPKSDLTHIFFQKTFFTQNH